LRTVFDDDDRKISEDEPPDRCIWGYTGTQRPNKWSHMSETFNSEQPEDRDDIWCRAPERMLFRLREITVPTNIKAKHPPKKQAPVRFWMHWSPICQPTHCQHKVERRGVGRVVWSKESAHTSLRLWDNPSMFPIFSGYWESCLVHQNLQQLKMTFVFSATKVSISFPTPSRPYPNYYE
jgi:hypothetical protein